MASPICTVNGSSTTNGVDISNNASVTIRLADTAGVKQWSISCINTDDLQSKAFINSILSVNQVTKTATFTATDAGDDGAAFIFESKVNSGVDSNGRADTSLTTRFGIYILTAAGVRVAALDETTEGNAEFGWVIKFNDVIRNFGGGGTIGSASAGDGLVFSGGAYNIAAADGSITVNANSIQVGTISAAQHGNQTSGTIHAAVTSLTNGFMIASDKAKLDTSTSSATASALAQRDSSGNCSFASVICTSIAPTGAGGTLTIVTEAQTGSSSSKAVSTATGTAVNGNSGSVTILTGGVTGSGNSGLISIASGGLSGSASGDSGTVQITSGNHTGASGNSGNVTLKTGSAPGTSGNVLIFPGTGTTTTGNISLGSSSGSFGSGQRVIFIPNATANPVGNPTGGGILYVNAGALTYRGSSGTVTVMGPA